MSLTRSVRFFSFFLCFGWMWTQPNLSAAQVSIASLGETVYAINNAGHAVGEKRTSKGTVPFLYRDGVLTELGNLGGNVGAARAINDTGQIAGGSSNSAGLWQPFTWQNGVMTSLPLLPGFSGGEAWGINNAGQIVGYNDSNSVLKGVLYNGGSVVDLSGFGIIFANDINNLGQVAGGNIIYDSTNSSVTAFGTLGGAFSNGFAINDLGVVVGLSEIANGDWRAFRYQAGQLTNLGTLGGNLSYALGVNNAGQIVGVSTSGSGLSRAFLYQGDTMIDLNTLIDPASGWTLDVAYGINDRGQIVGTGIRNGVQEGFLLNLSVPEPSSAMFLGSLSMGVIGLNRRRSKSA